MRAKEVALLVVTVAVAGCGGKGGGAPAPMDGGGNGGDAPADTSQPDGSGGPPVTSVPEDWSRPADCRGVGELCNGLGCGPGGMCQLIGDVCVPRLADINNPPRRTAETPYCLAYACMTYEQASCFCTGPAGAMYPSCKTGPAAVAGLCKGEESSCNEGACCDGLSCVTVSPTNKICYDRCAAGGECDTGCCTDRRDTGDLVCAPAASCQTPCVKRGGTCATYADCCYGDCVTGTTNTDWLGCRPPCTTSADCDTGCCQLYANSTTGFCTSAGYCGCGAGCPAGSSCSTFDGKTFACRKDCMEHTECPTQCCSGDLPGQNHGVCIAEECACPGGCQPGNSCLTIDDGASYQCFKHCMQPSECTTSCCSAPLAGRPYGACLPASACGF